MRTTAAVLLLLGLAFAGEEPVSLEILPDESPRREARWGPSERTMILRLRRTGPEGVRGKVEVPFGDPVSSFPFDLSEAEVTEIPARVRTLPAPFALLHDYEVEVLVGEDPILSDGVDLRQTVEWRIVGPFPGGVETDHDRVLPPETAPDQAEYVLPSGEKVAWRRVPVEAFRPDGTVKLDRVWPGVCDATAYAATTVFAREAGPARLLVGSDDAVKVWVNGVLVHDHRVQRACTPAEDCVPVKLDPGENRVLVKIGQTWGEWAYWLDFDDGEALPVRGLEWEIAYREVPVTEPRIRMEDVGRTGLGLEWRSARPGPAEVRVELARSERARPVRGGLPSIASLGACTHARPSVWLPESSARRRATVHGLEPGRRYLLSVSPAGAGGRSEPIPVRVGPPPKKAMVLRLRVAVVVFTNVVFARDAARPGASERVSKEEVERSIRECGEASRFYFVNSGGRLFLDNVFLVDDRPYVVPDGSPYGVGLSEGAPDREALDELLAARKETPADYDAIVFLTRDREWDEGGRRWLFPWSGGGTYGPDVGPGIGISAWKGGHLGTWLYVHEVGHQVDALYHHSGAPDFFFNHFSQWEGTAHHHGEHFDGNAWILREWAGYRDPLTSFRRAEAGSGCRYFACRWGEVLFPDDLDEDGLPDEAPELPVDEKRFGSRPDRGDTDGDGLGDLAELMATNGLDYGHSEIWAGPPERHRADPTKADSDGDGIPDGKDEHPLVPFPAVVSETRPVLDGIVEDGEYSLRIPLMDPEFPGEFFFGRRGPHLFAAGRFPTVPGEVKILVDESDDGWYRGCRAIDIRFRPGTEPALVLVDHMAWRGPPRARVPPSRACSKDGRVFEVRLDLLGFAGQIGVLLAAGPPGGVERYGTRGLLTVFEPHTFFRLTLK